MKTILATGGLGFIGSHTCISLLEKNFNICIVDSLVNSSKDNLFSIKKITSLSNKSLKGKISFYEGDIRDKEFLFSVFEKALIEKNPIEAVIHFAGLKSVYESIEKPLEYWDNNLTNIFHRQKDILVADSVLELFRKKDYIENFNKKALYIMIREMTGSNTQHITRVINQMKKYYFNMLQEFSADGQVDTSNTGSIF